MTRGKKRTRIQNYGQLCEKPFWHKLNILCPQDAAATFILPILIGVPGPPAFTAYRYVTALLPVPAAPAEIVSHDASLAAVHVSAAQLPDIIIAKVTVPAGFLGTDTLSGLISNCPSYVSGATPISLSDV